MKNQGNKEISGLKVQYYHLVVVILVIRVLLEIHDNSDYVVKLQLLLVKF
ncbi:hypothetical protein K6025_04875 [Ehrlichia sp. JZT12]